MLKVFLQHKYKAILFLTIFFTSCFGLILLENRIFKYLFTIVLFYYALTFKGNAPCKKIILLYTFFVLCSCIYSKIFNDQNLIRVIGNTYPYWGFLFVFIIIRLSPSSSQIEKAIKWLSIIFCICYLFQYIIYPINIFSGSLDSTNVNKETFRMRMPCSICAYCLFFFGVNKYILLKKKQFIFYAFLGLLPIFIMGFRSLTVATLLFSLFMIPFITKQFGKTLIWIAITCALLFSISRLSIIQEKMDEMLERQNDEQTFANKDYIRYLEYEYFTEIVYVKPGERFFGGGVPTDPSSKYYLDMVSSIDDLHYFWMDLGLIGLSFIIGIPSVILLVYIICKCIKDSSWPQVQYIRFTLLTILLGSIITSMELFRPGNLLIVSLYLCMLYIKHIEEKQKTLCNVAQ